MTGWAARSAILATMIIAQGIAYGDTSQMIRDAIAAYDQGDFSTAVELLQQVIDVEPQNGLAAYELALSLQAYGDLESCAAVAAEYLPVFKADEEFVTLYPQLVTVQASCLSTAGNTEEALAAFRAALADYPDEYGLNLNISITLINAGKPAVALPHLERAVRADPGHPSPYVILGGVYESLGRRTESILAHMVFLQKEFNTLRTQQAARSLISTALATARVDAETHEVVLAVPEDLSDAPEHLSTMAVALPLVSVSIRDESGKIAEPVADSIVTMLQTLVEVAGNLDVTEEPESFFTEFLFHPVAALAEAGIAAPFCWFVAATAGVEGSREWLRENQDQADAMVEFLTSAAVGR